MRDIIDSAIAFLRSRTVLLIAACLVAIVAIAAGYTTVTVATSTNDFCGHACHEMERTVYADYVKSKHYANAKGQVVTCAGCHLPPKGEQPAMAMHQLAALSRVWGHFVDREYLTGRFEARRPELAKKVLQGFAQTNARECKACHAYADMLKTSEVPMAHRDHAASIKTDANCLECHKGVSHQRQDQPTSYDF